MQEPGECTRIKGHLNFSGLFLTLQRQSQCNMSGESQRGQGKLGSDEVFLTRRWLMGINEGNNKGHHSEERSYPVNEAATLWVSRLIWKSVSNKDIDVIVASRGGKWETLPLGRKNPPFPASSPQGSGHSG